MVMIVAFKRLFALNRSVSFFLFYSYYTTSFQISDLQIEIRISESKEILNIAAIPDPKISYFFCHKIISLGIRNILYHSVYRKIMKEDITAINCSVINRKVARIGNNNTNKVRLLFADSFRSFSLI
jgi:hypothetical protein